MSVTTLPDGGTHSREMSGDDPRVLVICAVAPGSGSVGEIILRDLFLAYPKGQLWFFAPVGRWFDQGRVDTEAAAFTLFAESRFEGQALPLAGRLQSIRSMVQHFARFRPWLNRLAADAVQFAHRHRVDSVCVVLDSPTNMVLGHTVARRLRIPLHAIVWDAPEYLLQQRHLDRASRAAFMHAFDSTMRSSEGCAVVSSSMKQRYEEAYGTPAVLMRHASGYAPDPELTVDAQHVVIGLAGSLYARSAWDSLLAALDRMQWKLGGKAIVVRAIGADFHFKTNRPARIEYFGLRTVAETIDLLRQCHFTYLPIPFEPHLNMLAQLSFPTKLSSYVAAGRPVFVHAPGDAAVARFLTENPIGPHCASLDPEEMASALGSVMETRDAYDAYSAISERVASTELSRDRFLSAFATLITPGMLRKKARDFGVSH